MKVLLKKEVCESREQCMGPVNSACACEMLFSKKKKKSETQMRAFQHYPNKGLVSDHFEMKAHI